MGNLIMTYGLDSKQNMLLAHEFPDNDIRDVTGCFTDLIAVPAIAVVIDPGKLNKDERSAFNELFRYDNNTCVIFTSEPMNMNHILYVREDNPTELTESVSAIKERLDLPRRYACAEERMSNVISDVRDFLQDHDEDSLRSRIVNIDIGCFVYEVITSFLKHKKTLKLRERYPYRVELNSIMMAMMLAHGLMDAENLEESEATSFYDNEWIISLSENIRQHYRKTVSLNYKQ